MASIDKGIKIKNISAGMLYEVNNGTRDYFTYTDAVLNNSLFSNFLMKNGLSVHKGESTRDIVCLDFDFGSRSCKDELNRLNKLLLSSIGESREKLLAVIQKVEQNKDKYQAKTREEIREQFYQEGVPITYIQKNKHGEVIKTQTINYKMLYRTSAKAKLGQAMFINEKLYTKAHDWMTMGIGNQMPFENAKIVELSAYAPLTTSTIIGEMHIPVNNILILEDQDSLFRTMANVVKAEEYTYLTKGKTVASKRCVVVQEETDVKNTMWDGMGIIESSILPKYINGMALLRGHFFKMCGFRGHLQMFFRDWCADNGFDYNTHQVVDMFGRWHYVKDIKVITTDNAIKWKKFSDVMGDSLEAAYSYWCSRIESDGNMWGIVKTDHKSKLGKVQQMSYQMINTLPCTKEDITDITRISIDYVESLKTNVFKFIAFLRANKNQVNHYEMLADLYCHNDKIAESDWFREKRSLVIQDYVKRLRTGKIAIDADNLTVCGNPYALLLYSVGDDWTHDPTLRQEDGAIQCYTTRFENDEYLAAFRSPHNSPNNICHLHNVYSPDMKRYFPFSDNIIAVNGIQTDIQARGNGMDLDSDFLFVTNNMTVVKCARDAAKNYYTIVNNLKESGITYQNSKLSYANMDNKFAKSRLGIGWASNSAMLNISYYWTELSKATPNPDLLQQYLNNCIILSVVAQVIIDGCKREYEIDGMQEIMRIQKMPCMSLQKTFIDNTGCERTIRSDYPVFMKYVKFVPHMKNEYGEVLYTETGENCRTPLNRINTQLVCPMNWVEECLDGIKRVRNTRTIPFQSFFIKHPGRADARQIGKIIEIVNEYDTFIKSIKAQSEQASDATIRIMKKFEEMMKAISKVKIGSIYTINRLIEMALGYKSSVGRPSNISIDPEKLSLLLLNTLYRNNKDKFLSNFTSDYDIGD